MELPINTEPFVSMRSLSASLVKKVNAGLAVEPPLLARSLASPDAFDKISPS